MVSDLSHSFFCGIQKTQQVVGVSKQDALLYQMKFVPSSSQGNARHKFVLSQSHKIGLCNPTEGKVRNQGQNDYLPNVAHSYFTAVFLQLLQLLYLRNQIEILTDSPATHCINPKKGQKKISKTQLIEREVDREMLQNFEILVSWIEH